MRLLRNAAPRSGAAWPESERCQECDPSDATSLTIVRPAIPAMIGVHKSETTSALDAPRRNAPPEFEGADRAARHARAHRAGTASIVPTRSVSTIASAT